jgi:hypothetical protein
MIRQARIPFIAIATLLAACGSPATPPQSPANDETRPPPTTSDGETLGADRVPPGQKLQQSPKLDSRDGVKPAATPPHD